MISPMAARRRMAESTPSPGNCTRNGTCLTHGSQVEIRPSSASLSSHQRFQRLGQAHRLLDSELLGKRQIQAQPPIPLMKSKRLASLRLKMVPVQDAVQTIRGLCSRLYQSITVRHQGAQFPYFLRWHPHRRNEIGSEQAG